MSASPSLQIHDVSHDRGTKRRDPALVLEIPDSKSLSDGHAQGSPSVKKPPPIQTTTQVRSFTILRGQNQRPKLQIYSLINETSKEPESAVTRSTSATSSLDPYYFGALSATGSPVPPLPDTSIVNSHAFHAVKEPMTPSRDPATIDRRGLIGVGELATPRWAHTEKHYGESVFPEREKYQTVFANGCDVILEDGNDMPDSPWTIEAVDGELDMHSEVRI
jgi:dual specificity tyrosine-phosphorylation-regulated kinase 2/3/4